MENIVDLIEDIVKEAKVIDQEVIKIYDFVRDACKRNMCGLYNTRWTCPPAVGTLQECKERCSKYKKALVFTTCGKVEDSFDFYGMLDVRKHHDEIQKEVIQRVKNHFLEYMVLGAGGCTICKKCNYPNPCRFPEKAIPSVESYGISVVDLANDIGIRYNNGENTVTYFSIIFFNN